MMNRKEFYDYVAENIKDYLPEEYKNAESHLQEVTKNNDQVLVGLTVNKADELITPNIYLEDFYDKYVNGGELESIMSSIADLRLTNPPAELDRDAVIALASNYEAVKETMIIRVCDKDTNVDRLGKYAHTVHGDFAATYHIHLHDAGESMATIPITNQMVKDWGVSVEQLHQDAMAAGPFQDAKLYDLGGLLQSELFGREPQNLLETGMVDPTELMTPMFCLTNASRMDGASVVLRDEVLEQIGDVVGENYFVLPSSVHETIIVPDIGNVTLPELSSMVHEINETQVAPLDRLSDKVQYFDRETGVLENAQKRQQRLEKGKEEQNKDKKKGIHAKLEANKEKVKQQVKKDPVKHKDRGMEI